LVDSEAINVEAFHINNKSHWELAEYKDIRDKFQMEAIGVELALSEVYRDVKWPETDTQA